MAAKKKKLKKKKRAPKPRVVWHVYLLRCGDKSLYCGMTNELEARLKKHQAGKGARYTRSHLPVKLAYAEKVKNRSAALKREYAIKQLSRVEKERLVKSSPAKLVRSQPH